jgi:hypothetical protein
MNEGNGNSAKPLMYLVALYAAYRIVEAIVHAITMFFLGLVNIALAVTAILALYWVYRHITDKQFGETKKLQAIEKLERMRKLHLSRLPKHLREHANQSYVDRQRELYNITAHSRLDAFLDRTKQVLSTFRRRET